MPREIYFIRLRNNCFSREHFPEEISSQMKSKYPITPHRRGTPVGKIPHRENYPVSITQGENFQTEHNLSIIKRKFNAGIVGLKKFLRFDRHSYIHTYIQQWLRGSQLRE